MIISKIKNYSIIVFLSIIAITFGFLKYYKTGYETAIKENTELQIKIDEKDLENKKIIDELYKSKEETKRLTNIANNWKRERDLSEEQMKKLDKQISSLILKINNEQLREEAVLELNSEYKRILTCIESFTGKRESLCVSSQ